MYRSYGTVSFPLPRSSVVLCANIPQCQKCAREVYVEGVTARNGGEVVGITRSNGDRATLVNVYTDARTPCQNYSGPSVKDGPC